MSTQYSTFSTMDVSRKRTPRTLIYTGLIFGLLFTFSGCNACQPTEDELVESKFYRSEIVLQATVSTRGEDAVATVERTLKYPNNETEVTGEIKLTGFGTEDPCFWEFTDLSETTEYYLFLGEMIEDEFYPIVANPVESTKDVRKNIRKFDREGAAPTFDKELKTKVYSQGDRATVSCLASGYPTPNLTMAKDGVKLSKGAVKGLRYKSGRGGIRLKFKNLQKDLHEGVYACIADNGVHPQVMTSATIGICALTCSHGKLNLKLCECGCDNGWNGIECSIPLEPITPAVQPCNLNCGEHGRVASDECRCHCDGNYIGKTCDVLCDKTCDTHGTLNRDTCTCECESGYYGETCSSTADDLCDSGEFCLNGGTCHQVDDPKTRELFSLCRCADGFIGERCEIESDLLQCNINCSPYGTKDVGQCECICDKDHRGTYCQLLKDDHTEPCGPKYEHYCLNGGVCIHLKGIMKPSCRCRMLYYGHRCDRVEPNPDCGCIHGGECRFNDTKQEYECICPTHFGGNRCQLVKPGYSRSPTPHHRARRVKRYWLFDQGESTQKMIITLCVIFVAMLMVIGLVIIVYIRNRNAREKERRERLEQFIRQQRNGMRLRASLQSTGAGGSYPADDIEMTNFCPAASKQTDFKVEKEGTASMPSNPSQGKGSLPRNGGSQASLHSSDKQRENDLETKRGKGGYEAVPTEDKGVTNDDAKNGSGESSPEGPGDPDTLPSKHQRASSDLGSESEDSDGEGDAVDVPNPQIQAIQSHLGSDHDSGDYTWDEHSSPGLRITAPYPTNEVSPSRNRGSGRSPDHVNIHDNPMENTGAKRDAMNNVMSSPKDAYYADRLKDVVEGSPPSAV